MQMGSNEAARRPRKALGRLTAGARAGTAVAVGCALLAAAAASATSLRRSPPPLPAEADPEAILAWVGAADSWRDCPDGETAETLDWIVCSLGGPGPHGVDGAARFVAERLELSPAAAHALVSGVLLARAAAEGFYAGEEDRIRRATETIAAAIVHLEQAVELAPRSLAVRIEAAAAYDLWIERIPERLPDFLALLRDGGSDGRVLAGLEERTGFRSRKTVLAAWLDAEPGNPVLLAHLAIDAYFPPGRAGLLYEAWTRTLDLPETGGEAADLPATFLAYLAQQRLDSLVRLGQFAEALELFDGAPAEVQRMLIEGDTAVVDATLGDARLTGRLEDGRLDLAALFALTGRPEAAREILVGLSYPLGDPDRGGEPSLELRRDELLVLRLRQRALGALLGAAPSDRFRLVTGLLGLRTDLSPTRGTLWSAVAARLGQTLGSPALERWALGLLCRLLPPPLAPAVRPVADPVRFPLAAEEAARLETRAAELRRATWGTIRSLPGRAAALPTWCAVDPTGEATGLAAAIRLVEAGPGRSFDELYSESEAARPVPEGISLPEGWLPQVALRDGEATLVVAQPPESLDPAPAYWLLRSAAPGGPTDALFTGLRVNRPYWIPPHRDRHRWRGDRLALALAVLPNGAPAGLLPSRPGEHFVWTVAEIDLAALARDGDGDGLTDLYEEHLGLDPGLEDTDGDGLGDADDPLPQIAGRGRAVLAEAEAFAAVLRRIDEQARRTGGLHPEVSLSQAALATETLSSAAHRPSMESALRLVVPASPSEPVPLGPAPLHRPLTLIEEDRPGADEALVIQLFELAPDGRRAVVVWSRGRDSGVMTFHLAEEGWKVKRGRTTSGCVTLRIGPDRTADGADPGGR